MLKKIRLTGEQRKVLSLPVQNPVQIKGVAGSGKTTVAMYRARHLLDTYQNLFSPASVAIITYSKPLTQYIKHLLPNVGNADAQQIGKGLPVGCYTFHSWAYGLCKSHGKNLGRTVRASDKATLITQAAQARSSSKTVSTEGFTQSIGFFEDEFSWIKGRGISTLKEYKDTPRTGRGTKVRVSEANRTSIWRLFERYQQLLRERSSVDYDDYALIAHRVVSSSSFKPPFSHLVIDEAQDLTKMQLKVLAKAVQSETKSITLIADAAQRIYRNGFSWREVGINVAGGRSVELSIDYRNPKGIALAAAKILNNEADKSDFTKLTGAKPGDQRPIVEETHGPKEALEWLVEQVSNISLKEKSVAILHRRNYPLTRISSYLKSQGIGVQHFRDLEDGLKMGKVVVCTMNSVKGMEFDYVFILGANDSNIPMITEAIPANELDEDAISAERRLFYTAMTRACEQLYIQYSGRPCMFVKELLG